MKTYEPKDIEEVAASAFRACALRIQAELSGHGLFSLKTKLGELHKLRIGGPAGGLSRDIVRGDIQPSEIELYGVGRHEKGISLEAVIKDPRRLERWAEQRRK